MHEHGVFARPSIQRLEGSRSAAVTRAHSEENLPSVFQVKSYKKPTFGKVVIDQVKE